VSPTRHYPVRWWYSGYRDGYVGVARDDSYLKRASEAELVAYRNGFERGAGERKRQDKHDRLMAGMQKRA
jgi:hypothetical protein